MKVLSLFDWISCGLEALKRAWINVETYYASEIDKYAIQVSEKNHPEIIRLWDINNRKEWDIGEIDMVIWGSPCQWFSLAGKQLAFDDPRSKLFFTMVDIINHYKPKYFLLENVKMKKEYKEVIDEYMWVKSIEINSSLLSAQSRKRLYWTNIPNVEQPIDKGLFLKDILEENVDKKFYMNAEQIMWVRKSNYMDRQPYHTDQKCWTLKVGWDVKRIFATQIGNSKKFGNSHGADKAYTLRASNPNWVFIWWEIRYLTPIECERLQTLPDGYTEWISKTQRYKALGNGWTVDVISHILSYLKKII